MCTRDKLMNEYWKAVSQLDEAYNHFENAEPGFVDAAIAELSSASTKIAAIRSKIKQMEDGIYD